MELYDKGEEKAYLALFTAFAKEKYEVCKEKVGILGMTPQDVSDLKAADKVREELKKEGKEAICYGMGDGLEAVERSIGSWQKYCCICGSTGSSQIFGKDLWYAV
ncbi:MAG: hypothetical protein ACLR2O_04525 [Coprococcus sp.]